MKVRYEMKGYKVMCSIRCTDYDGQYDCYTEEYSGIIHSTREEARAELINAKNDINIDALYIKEV